MDLQSCAALSIVELTALKLMHGIPPISDTIYLFLAIFAFQYLSLKAFYTLIYPFFLSPLRRIPGPKNHHFLVGQTLNQLRANGPYELYLSWSRTWPDTPFIRYISFGNSETLLVNSLKAHQEVLQAKCYSFVKPPFFARIVGEVTGMGLVFAEGEEHRKQRKLLNGIFSTPNMKKLVPVVQLHAKNLITTMGQAIGNGESVDIEVVSLFSKATLDIIGVITLGKELESLNTTTSFHACYDRIFNQSSLSSLITAVNTWIPLRRWLPLEANLSFIKANDEVKRILREQIRTRKKEIDINADAKNNGSLPISRDVLTYLLEAQPPKQQQWTEDELLGYLLNFMSAGHETSATTLTWAIHCLSIYPDIQKRVREEILALPQDTDLDYSQIESLRYLNNFCREVLRVYTPAVMIWRQAAQAVVIENTVIPAGTNVIISPQVPHFHPHIWGSSAELFDPDRWDSLTPEAASPYAFQAFSSGPRVCIGKGLAVLEFKTILVEMVKQFRFEPIEQKIILENYLTLRPKGGLKVKVRSMGEEACRTMGRETEDGGRK